MASKTEIANKALGFLGVSRPIGNLETTLTATAAALRTFYNDALEDALRGFWWPFAGRYTTLALVEDLSQSSTADYPYVYGYPSECLEIRRVQTPGDRSPTSDCKVPFITGGSDSQKLVYTILNPAEIWYTKNVSDPQFYPSDFVTALALKLAFWSAAQIVGGTAENLRKELATFFTYQIGQAKTNARREQQQDQEASSVYERSRR